MTYVRSFVKSGSFVHILLGGTDTHMGVSKNDHATTLHFSTNENRIITRYWSRIKYTSIYMHCEVALVRLQPTKLWHLMYKE
jgi:hypothetical protein